MPPLYQVLCTTHHYTYDEDLKPRIFQLMEHIVLLIFIDPPTYPSWFFTENMLGGTSQQFSVKKDILGALFGPHLEPSKLASQIETLSL